MHGKVSTLYFFTILIKIKFRVLEKFSSSAYNLLLLFLFLFFFLLCSYMFIVTHPISKEKSTCMAESSNNLKFQVTLIITVKIWYLSFQIMVFQSLMRRGAASTQTAVHMGCWNCQQRLNLVCHNAIPMTK